MKIHAQVQLQSLASPTTPQSATKLLECSVCSV